MKRNSENDLKIAKETLIGGLFTLAYSKDGKVFTEIERGVKPLIKLYESKKDFSLFSFADKVVGKGAAVLYLLLKIKKLHALVISKPAYTFLKEHGVLVFYDEIVDNIINRKGDGICPIEESVLYENDIYIAYEKIKQKLKTLS